MPSSALELLVDCAQAIRDGDLKLADSLLGRIWELADDESDKRQSEVVRYFAEALVRRVYGLHSIGNYFTTFLYSFAEHDYDWFCCFYERVKDTIFNVATGKKQLHLIGFNFLNLDIVGYLTFEVYKHYSDIRSVRTSVILPTILEKTAYVENTRQQFNTQFKHYKPVTEDLKIVYANSLREVDESMLDFKRTEDEAVVICYWFKLHQLLAETGAIERELLKLKDINPEIVIIAEQNADHNNPDFIQRLRDSFQYYSNAFCFNLFHDVGNFYRRQIHNIVGCEGRDRIVRHQTFAQWQSHLQLAGFFPVPFEFPNDIEDDKADVRIHEHNGSAVFTLKNRQFFFISAWKFTDKENYFNPMNNHFIQGFYPSALLEDKVQPFQPLPEGFLLNQLATFTEIYDILEEVCSAYQLRLALTWVCRANVNEIMSDANKNRTLFIQSTFCYVDNFLARAEIKELLKICEKHRLLEGQAIAGKALQSNEDFYFESSIAELEELDHPIAYICEFLLDCSHSAVAICLHNSFTMDVDYVVEFFLPTVGRELENPKSMAFRIFNDLKNMKKLFVTVGVRGTEVQFQQKAISSAKRRKLTSDVWEEFTKKEDGDGKVSAICAHCSRAFDGSSTKGTTHLRNHLKRCKSRPTNARDQQLILPVEKDGSKNESATEGNSSFDQDRTRMDVARMIIRNQCPFNLVEDEFFISLFKSSQPMFKLQSKEALLLDIVGVYEEEKDKLLEYFDKLSCRFNLTISLWAHDLEKSTYCCYVVQFVDDNWELKKKILALKNLGNQFDKKIFYENFKDFLRDWNLDKKVCSLIIQNSSSCFDIAEEIRKSWHCFEGSYPSSTFYLGSDECIRALLYKDNSGENVGKSTNGVIRTSNACLLEIFRAMYSSKKLGQQEGIGYPLMNVKFDNNWRLCSLVLAIAAVLDPRFRFQFVEFSYNEIYGSDVAKIHLTMIREALTGIFNEYASNMNSETSFFHDTNSLTLLNVEANIMESFHRWHNSKKITDTEASWKSELAKYVDQEPLKPFNSEFDILGWWCEQASSFPILGRMVRDILAIPLSSIISGSTFTEKVMLDNPIFSGLDPQIIEAMICGRNWLESPKGISNVEPNKKSGNIGCPIVKLEKSSALAHHSEIELFFSESNNEAPGNEDLGRKATSWTEKDVRLYLVSPFTVEELEHLRKWQNHPISGEYVGQDKIQDKALAPLLMIPPKDIDLKDARNYYIEDTVVNQFFVLLKRRYERFPHKYLKHHSFDSSYATFLINGSKAESELLSWVKQEDLKGVSKLFLPMCLHEHWLLFVADIDDKKLLWLDSNEHSRMSNVSEKNVIQRWFLKYLLPSMGHDHKDWPFDVSKDIPQQKNSVDCALFVMKYADCLTHGNYFPFAQEDMHRFRLRTFLDLYFGSISLGMSQDDRANHAPQQNTVITKRKMDEKESSSLVKISKKWNSEETKRDNAKDYNINDGNPSLDIWLESAGEKTESMEVSSVQPKQLGNVRWK